MKRKKEVKNFIRKRYGEIAEKGTSCCPSCCCGEDMVEHSQSIGYSEREIKSIPTGAVMGLGCGNPAALAELKKGETVLDLGAGGGLDAFLASRKVGKKGKVIGVDMTPEMIKRARANAKKGNYRNVEFRLGEIENLPVKDKSIDVILSNCVINLSPDKLAVYKESFRVLKTGGRILISDIVTKGRLTEKIRKSFEAWAGCVAGALEKKEYLKTIRKAGFKNIKVLSERAFSEPGMSKKLKVKIFSIQVRACK